ncbi:MAG TPA: hypothetical protein VK465_02520, partial [Fibrobacteria bacterium]|nr:hypothetical protein [Fibrobacteria bacterium]
MMKRIAITLKPLACWALALGLFAAPAMGQPGTDTAKAVDAAAAVDTTKAGSDTAAPAPAATEAAAPAGDSALMARVADLEAYMNNVAPTKLTGIPGPGHNGFMMICAALVLFMTLPGLALFYGGLVRTKNVLSVVAQ